MEITAFFVGLYFCIYIDIFSLQTQLQVQKNRRPFMGKKANKEAEESWTGTLTQ